MAVGIDATSIKMTVNDTGVKPIIKIDKSPLSLGGMAFAGGSLRCELSQLKSLKKRLEAFTLTSHVKFKMEPGDTLDNWKIGFVQIVRQNTLRAVYAGRFRQEGSIVCDIFPKSTKFQILLDSDKVALPFYEMPDEKTDFKGSEATPSTGDNPQINVPLSLANDEAARVDNFLMNFEHDIEFWTVLTAMDPTKTLRHLAHVPWHLKFSTFVLWRAGIPVPSTASSSLSFRPFVIGPPTEPPIAKLLSSPTGPTANDTLAPAFNNSLIGGPSKDPEMHHEFPEWQFGTPDFFWQ